MQEYKSAHYVKVDIYLNGLIQLQALAKLLVTVQI